PPDTFTLASETLGRDLHVYVRVPQSYEASDEVWPVIYLLDGGILFPMLVPYHFMLTIDEIAPEAIIVGISYGGLGFANGNMRSTDYTAASAEVDHYGGASVFQAFLEEQLLPLIDERYRTDPQRRVIVGQSLGGQFVLYTALTRPGLFWGHIAINPALHRNLAFFRDYPSKPDGGRARLFVGAGTLDAPRFREPALEWIDAWIDRADSHLDLEVASLEGQHHASAAPEAYRVGLRWLFNDQASR
ncbi:alpha/beta hydrolase-fold protein, partial [Marivita sp.]|uniref:alpha/beta hydrolase n=1 Tax=Marivita sp. TaxID=2003365 RepID=UPI0025C13C4F